MNGIERITRRIESDAQEEADRVLNEARTEAARIAEEFRVRAEAEAASLADRNQKAAAQREERLVSMAQMEARKTILAAKQELVERAYALALDKLCAMPETEYTAALAGLLEEASATGTEEVVFSAADRERVGKQAVDRANGVPAKPAKTAKTAAKGAAPVPPAKAKRRLTLSKDTADIRGGFLLRDRNVEVNCTFETLVRLQKGQTAGAVAKRLFP